MRLAQARVLPGNPVLSVEADITSRLRISFTSWRRWLSRPQRLVLIARGCDVALADTCGSPVESLGPTGPRVGVCRVPVSSAPSRWVAWRNAPSSLASCRSAHSRCARPRTAPSRCASMRSARRRSTWRRSSRADLGACGSRGLGKGPRPSTVRAARGSAGGYRRSGSRRSWTGRAASRGRCAPAHGCHPAARRAAQSQADRWHE